MMGDTRTKLAACNVTAVIPNAQAYTALCSDGSLVSWGHPYQSNCTPHFNAAWSALASPQASGGGSCSSSSSKSSYSRTLV